jgi:hypothetical protein
LRGCVGHGLHDETIGARASISAALL